MATIIGEDTAVYKYCTCWKCAAKVQYVPLEVKKDYTSDYTGSRDYYWYVECPRCFSHITKL